MADKLDISVFGKDKNVISLGKIRPEIIDFLSEKVPEFVNSINPDNEILFWKDRLKHTELHKNDFRSDNEFYMCLENIPNIINKPDYISINPKANSISFVRDFSAHIAVAIRISVSGTMSYRTMYPIMDAQLTAYIDRGRAWKWKESVN